MHVWELEPTDQRAAYLRGRADFRNEKITENPFYPFSHVCAHAWRRGFHDAMRDDQFEDETR